MFEVLQLDSFKVIQQMLVLNHSHCLDKSHLPENLTDKIYSSDFYQVLQSSPLGRNLLSRRSELPEGNSVHIF